MRLLDISSFIIFILLLTLWGCNTSDGRGGLSKRETPFGYSNLKSENDEYSIFRNTIYLNTDTSLNTYVEYWPNNNNQKIFRSDTSENRKNHQIKLLNLIPETEYSYRVILFNNTDYSETETKTFKTKYIPIWLDNYYLPKKGLFQTDGNIFIYKRKSPGVLVLLDSKGDIQWYNVFNNFLKTAFYTKDNTVLCILSDPGYKTAYGNHLIELSLKGDTLLHIQSGTFPFNHTFHHELLLDSVGNIVTLTVVKKIVDLSSIGGSKDETLVSDGIQIISRQGEKLWEWSIFDIINPLKEKGILSHKEDWLHANSLCYDKDGNILISFYIIHQIWKINSKTGALIWRLGKDGDFKMKPSALFSGQHSIHINQLGHLMMFDNGLDKKRSRALSLKLDEKNLTTEMIIDAPLPKSLFSPKMGSAYLLDKHTILQCSTNKDVIAATDLKGKILWQFKVGGLTYRAQFINDN